MNISNSCTAPTQPRYSKVVDTEGKPLNFGGMYIKNDKVPSIPQHYLKMFNDGLALREKMRTEGTYKEATWNNVSREMSKSYSSDPSKQLDAVMFELGWRGYKIEELTPSVASRMGDIPNGGMSKDNSNQYLENGVSVIDILTEANQNEKGFYDLIQERGERTYVAGFLNPQHNGADGEPLLLFPVKIKGGRNSIKSATGNKGTFNPNDANILHQTAPLIGTHYSNQPREELNGSFFSTGIEGAEAKRLAKLNAYGQGQQDLRGSYAPDTHTLSMLNKADLTTFVHELGHHFLEMTSDLASRPDAPQGIRDDMAKITSWFGTTPEAWRGMTPEQRRPHHEQFAESFERYLLEGRAPSMELQPVFSRVRSWMLNVYKSLQGLLSQRPAAEQLTPEVRQVFDRMLASEVGNSIEKTST